jgi:hypothetical protein
MLIWTFLLFILAYANRAQSLSAPFSYTVCLCELALPPSSGCRECTLRSLCCLHLQVSCLVVFGPEGGIHMLLRNVSVSPRTIRLYNLEVSAPSKSLVWIRSNSLLSTCMCLRFSVRAVLDVQPSVCVAPICPYRLKLIMPFSMRSSTRYKSVLNAASRCHNLGIISKS